MYRQTTATEKLLKLKKRIRVVAGGTSASKTISILLLLIDEAQSDTSPTLTSVVSESIPHLKRGAIRDFLSIMKEHGYYKEDSWNKTDHTYTFETGSKIEFFGADQADKLRGARRDRLFINEGNNITFNAFNELEVRTKSVVWVDFNPTNEFWFYTEIKDNSNMDVDFITLTYKDNEALDDEIVASIESRKSNANWWKVYGLGQLGEFEGKIYKDWEIISEIPHMAKLVRRGLDFGFSNDPLALVDIYKYDGGYILDEQLYSTGIHNEPAAEYIKNLKEPNTLVIADSAEPKSIAQMKMLGVIIQGANKGGDAKRFSIEIVQGLRISVTSRSINLIREYRNYMWKTDKQGKQLQIPEDGNDDLLDAAMYGLISLHGRDRKVKVYRQPAVTQRMNRYA